MKKLLAVATIAIFAIGATSCKKEYECCYYENGQKLSIAGYGCATATMSKSEKEDTEAAAQSSLDACGSACDGWTFECN